MVCILIICIFAAQDNIGTLKTNYVFIKSKEPMIKLQCVALRSPNPKKLVDFYEKVFGLKFTLQKYPCHYHKDWYVAYEESGGRAILEIHELKDGESFIPVSFSFRVDSSVELQEIKKGIWDYQFPDGYKIPDTSHDKNIMLDDIDGNKLFVMM